MIPSTFRIGVFATLLVIFHQTPASADTNEVLITEFMAVNSSTLKDKDDVYSDWLEVYNNTAAAIDLNGWYLTDDAGVLTKWAFPARMLAPGEFLLVFCSGVSSFGAELHANFKLASDGEYLAVVKQDGLTVSHSYAPVFPPQVADLAYGLDMLLTETALVAVGADGKMLLPTNGSLGTDWTAPGFDDSAWTAAINGVGYDTTGMLSPLIATDVEATMANNFPGVYLRYPFAISGAVDVDRLVLGAKYDDGFVTYLNGTLVCDENISASPVWDSTALSGNVSAMSVSDFKYPEPTYSLVNHSGAAGAIIGGTSSYTSKFMRLIYSGSTGNANHLHFDRTDTGVFGEVTIDFDFRMNGTADGFSVLMLPTSVYGVNSATDSYVSTGEEPNVAGAFAVGFDVYSNIDEVSVHYGSTRGEVNKSANIQLNNNTINHAHIVVSPQGGGGSKVSVSVTPGSGGLPVAFFENLTVADLNPYEFRLQFSGRTGGETTNVDLDNISVTQTGQPGLTQTFDGGGTSYKIANTGGTLAAVQNAESAPSGETFARLTYLNATSNSNTIHFSRANEGAYQRLTAEFDFRMDGAADGFGFCLLPTSIYGATTANPPAIPNPAEEPSLAGTFAVGFDIYNDIDEISLHYGGLIAEVNKAGTINFSSNQWHRAHISIEPNPVGGSLVSVSVTPNVQGIPGVPVVFHNNVSVPNFEPYEYRLQFTGRTGGATTTIDIDNILMTGLAADGALEVSKVIDKNLLMTGSNVLAIHGVNADAADEDFLARPELNATKIDSVDVNTPYYFQGGTPGAPNVSGVNGPTGDVTLTSGSTFSGSTQVSMSAVTPGSTIYYTTDGTIPTDSSVAYSTPITLTTTTQIRARAFAPNFAPSAVETQTYVALAADVLSFTSDLPLVVIDNFSAGAIPGPGTLFQPTVMTIHDRKLPSNRSSLVNSPDIITRAGIHKRGSSTAGQPKPNLRVEAWKKGSDDDRNIAPLGMPADSDWVLYAPYDFDRAFMRNGFIYELSNDLGQYAVRTRYVEVFINTGGGALSYSDDYQGVYVLMETIKQGTDRLDIAKIDAVDTTAPNVTGGYIWKIDRPAAGETQFTAGGLGGQVLVDPDEFEIAPEQDAYIKGYINSFGAALNGGSFTDPVTGYEPFIDTDSWIDTHLINVLAYNVDAFRLSTFLHKDRNGVIVKGPVWDFDRSLESYDSRDDVPQEWGNTGGVHFFQFGWFDRLFDDPDFSQKWIDRWCSQRAPGGKLTNAHLFSILDGDQAELAEAAPRNYAEWPGVPPTHGGNLAGEVQNIKNWLTLRTTWIDSQFVEKPVHKLNGTSVQPGVYAVNSGDVLTFTPSVGTTVYYKTDGNDPRGDGGIFAGTLYSSGISISQSLSVPARGYKSGNPVSPLNTRWGAPATATFLVGSEPADASGLVISEVHYRPADVNATELTAGFTDRDDFEFIELLNKGATTIDLVDCYFGAGIDFKFPFSTVLTPGERLVLAKNLAAFELRYGSGIRVIGGYGGRLGNDGELVQLLDWSGALITEFSYNDTWFRITDGGGHSMELKDPDTALAALNDAGSWGISCDFGGTPGYASAVFGYVYDLWADTYFTPADLADSTISGVLADGDSDGALNLLEYALNKDPKDSRSVPALTPGEVGGKLAVTFTRRVKALDIDYIVEASSDLENWVEITEEAGAPVDAGNGMETVSIMDNETISAAGLRFVRLRVEMP